MVIGLALVVYTWTLLGAARARGKSGIKSPATTGDVTLERALRVQQNTLEQLIVFVPAIVLFAMLVSPLVAPILGAIWLAGRVLYIPMYMRNPDSRGAGFTIAFLPQMMLVAGAIGGAVIVILHG